MVGCRRGPDPEKIRMYVLRSRIRDAVYVVEDEHGDLVPAVREARPRVTSPREDASRRQDQELARHGGCGAPRPF